LAINDEETHMDRGLRDLMAILGDIKGISESGRYRWHGCGILIYETTEQYYSAIGGLSNPGETFGKSPYKLSESELASVISVDGVCVLDLQAGVMPVYGAHLPVIPEKGQAWIDEYNVLKRRGARHRAAAGYAKRTLHSSVFVMSQDGGCIVVRHDPRGNGDSYDRPIVAKLW
jgi:hypothetical protein